MPALRLRAYRHGHAVQVAKNSRRLPAVRTPALQVRAQVGRAGFDSGGASTQATLPGRLVAVASIALAVAAIPALLPVALATGGGCGGGPAGPGGGGGGGDGGASDFVRHLLPAAHAGTHLRTPLLHGRCQVRRSICRAWGSCLHSQCCWDPFSRNSLCGQASSWHIFCN